MGQPGRLPLEDGDVAAEGFGQLAIGDHRIGSFEFTSGDILRATLVK